MVTGGPTSGANCLPPSSLPLALKTVHCMAYEASAVSALSRLYNLCSVGSESLETCLPEQFLLLHFLSPFPVHMGDNLGYTLVTAGCRDLQPWVHGEPPWLMDVRDIGKTLWKCRQLRGLSCTGTALPSPQEDRSFWVQQAPLSHTSEELLWHILFDSFAFIFFIIFSLFTSFYRYFDFIFYLQRTFVLLFIPFI